MTTPSLIWTGSSLLTTEPPLLIHLLCLQGPQGSAQSGIIWLSKSYATQLCNITHCALDSGNIPVRSHRILCQECPSSVGFHMGDDLVEMSGNTNCMKSQGLSAITIYDTRDDHMVTMCVSPGSHRLFQSVPQLPVQLGMLWSHIGKIKALLLHLGVPALICIGSQMSLIPSGPCIVLA
jgi:hypothetical protein